MILKKPYAFLIKYFKLIHILLLILTAFIVYKSYNIINFFNDYVLNNYSGNYYSGFYTEYISPILYIVIIIILIGISAIIVLLLNRKKPIKIYIANIIYYVILIIFLSVVKNTMISLVDNVMTAESARIYRDVSLIIIIPQIVFFILFLTRGLGINVKKFNFEKDIKEFEILAQDNEEFEFTFKNDGVKLKRTTHRFFREFIYYIKENKFMFIIISTILLIIIIYFIYKSFPEITDVNYKQGDMFFNNYYKISITDSIITNLDYKGNIINNGDYYLVAKLVIENTSGDNKNIDYNNFRLEANDEILYPSGDQSNYFVDYASNCHVGILKSKSSQTCVLAYKIDISKKVRNYKIKVQNGNIYENGVNKAKYNYITLTPVVINQIINENIVNEGELINFSNSNLGNTSIKLSNAFITDKYVYNYDYCDDNGNNCKTYKNVVSIDYFKNNNLLIVADIESTIDNNTDFYKYSGNIDQIMNTFTKIKYIKDDNILYLDAENVSPSSLKGKVVLETSNIIEDADSLYICLIIRNKEYAIKIK